MSITINSIPIDILKEIFLYLDDASLSKVERVCKQWKDFTSEAWKKRFWSEKWNFSYLKNEEKANWKELYKQVKSLNKQILPMPFYFPPGRFGFE